MATALRHRGPDSADLWADASAGIALGHRRLAIIDLSAAGSQPMTSHSGRFVMIYNGEIYNHQALRIDLNSGGRAPDWRGHSDTETLLAGIEALGLDATLRATRGMFALALWDRKTRHLTLARDRLGEKPLYYGWQGAGEDRTFLFGSELKALAAHPTFEAQVDRNALPEFLRHGHIGEDRSIYCGIHKLRPGEILDVSVGSPTASRRTYWSGAQIAVDRGGEVLCPATPEAAVDALETVLVKSIDRQMISDVPLGAFLSGGIDSSAVVALMQHLSDRPVLTFSIGFHEARYNEAGFASAVAQHLGTQHTELYVDDVVLLDVVPKLPTIYDEPFADSSQIPTYLVAQLARQHVTVALSGDGGDELFSGYDRYGQGARLMRLLRHVPGPLKRVGGSAVRGIPKSMLDQFLAPMRRPAFGKEPNGQWAHRMADYLSSASIETLHRKLVSRWRFPEEAVLGAVPNPTLLDDLLPQRGMLCDIERMMQLDMLTYLPDDILTKVDRATMAVSLEARAPFLDPDVVAFAWALPQAYKHRDRQSKWALREVLHRHVPRALIDRPKMGFEVPIGAWLRGPLRDWAGDLLEPARLTREGWFDAAVITRHVNEHLSGRCNWGMQLWNVLAFQAWHEAATAQPGTPQVLQKRSLMA
jgi:asparagine synthase (glutamine-hydrolysing)